MEVTSVRSSWRVVMAVTLGGWLGACVGNGGWNEGAEENTDDSEPAIKAEGGETECDEDNKDKCCHDSDSIEAGGNNPFSAPEGVCLARG